LAYESHTDPRFYTMRFIDGLKDHIKSAVLLQRPSTLDTACALAQLQEEVSEPGRADHRKFISTSSTRPAYSPLPLPRPPQPEALVADSGKLNSLPRSRQMDDKLASLKAYRRARGLCDRCADKWVSGHRCAPTVQLHALEELWELIEDKSSTNEVDTGLSPPGELLSLSLSAVSGIPSRRTIQFSGECQGHPIVLLVDSGSSHSFVSSTLAGQLSGISPLPHPVTVQVADGGNVSCSQFFSSIPWSVQGYTFFTDFRVFPLKTYDAVLGMDWLEQFSPMKINWTEKWLSIPYKGHTVVLQGKYQYTDSPDLFHVVYLLHAMDSDSAMGDVDPKISEVLQSFQPVFDIPQGLPPSRSCDHSIPLIQGYQPVFIWPYRYAPAVKDEIERQVNEMLASGIIQHSNSPFSSPVLLVRKKDQSWRFCVDFRHLNALTVKRKYPVPIIEELMDELQGASWFSSLDLRAGFHQILLKEGEEFKTAFQTHSGHYEFRVMAFGLTGAPATFQSAMNSTLQPVLRKFALVFFDDILVYSPTLNDHVEHLSVVLSLLQKDQWKVKLSKCTFATRSISYLGHVISEAGVQTDPNKVTAVVNWPTPSNVKELRSFLGLAGYYRKFVQHFGIISKPLTLLLKKNSRFLWTQEQDIAFHCLKTKLSQAPVLALPDFSKPFVLETDACDQGIGAVLMQGGHPLAYVSKALGPQTRGLSTYEKEYLAILMAVDHWRAYLQHSQFVIHTDQRSLVHLNEQRLHTIWQQKVFYKLLGLQYSVSYKKGSENSAADALSRKPSHDSSCAAISTVAPSWASSVADSYLHDPKAQELLVKLFLDASSVPHFSLKDGILRYKNRIWVGFDPQLHHKLVTTFHHSPVGGHSGVPVTYRKIKQVFAWPGLKSFVQTWVASYVTCQ
jgi:hypothetical protein